MKYSVDITDPSEWLNFLNSEADPDLESQELKIANIDKSWMVAYRTGVGLFVSPSYTVPADFKEKDLEAWLSTVIDEVKQAAADKKELHKQAKGFLSF